MRTAQYAGALATGLAAMAAVVALAVTQTPTPTLAQTQEAALRDVTPLPPPQTPSLVQTGKASWYGPRFHGRTTANGDRFNRYALTAASRSLRPGTVARVTNLRNGRSTVVLINDWGPVPEDRVIDVSEAVADILGFRQQGLAPVRIEVFRTPAASL